MKRRHLTRRQKWPLHLGLFLLYIIIQFVTTSNSLTTQNTPTTSKPISSTIGSIKSHRSSPSSPTDSSTKKSVDNNKSSTQRILTTSTMKGEQFPYTTMRPKRENCSSPAIEQFPKPFVGPSARKHGGLIIHLAIAIYTFLGLAIVCDDYFVSSLDRICEELRLSPDVAGATFMAAGSSAPELATVMIAVFCAKDDIGVESICFFFLNN